MKKVVITDVGVEYTFDTDYDCNDKPTPIRGLSDMLIDAKKEGATHVKMNGNSYSNYLESIEFQPVIIIEESDEAYKIRTEKEEAIIAARNDDDLKDKIKAEKALLAELKLKYPE